MYRIGLIVDSTRIQKQYADLVAWAQSQSDIEISAVVIQKAERSRGNGLRNLIPLLREVGLYRLLSRIAFSALVRTERKATPRRHLEELNDCDVGALVPEHIWVDPIRSKSGFVHRFSEDDLERIRALKLDLLVRCGSGILRGGILDAARCGIISVHHGNNRVNRGGPPGFWEVRYREPDTGFVVQRLTDELDGGEVLRRGSAPTDSMFLRNQAMIYGRSAEHLQRAIRELLDGSAKAEEPHLYYQRLYKAPMLGDVLAYVARTAMRVVKNRARQLRGIDERWSVAIAQTDWRRAVLWRSKEIPNPDGSFLADPFVHATRDGRHILFVEEYIYARRTGIISAYEVKPDLSTERLGVVLDDGENHLSFPFVFEHEGQLYMCPETASRRQVRLYRCVDFPLRWELASVLLDDVRTVDTMIFPKEGRWWLLTNINNSGFGSASELHAYHADSPLGTWTPVKGNPVVFDALRGRNGGLLRSGEDIYRVAQRPCFGTYGSALSIYRITRLDEEGYDEVKLQDVEPAFRDRLSGTHHMHHDGGLLAFDLLRWSRIRGRS